jgi:hypothetical protein
LVLIEVQQVGVRKLIQELRKSVLDGVAVGFGILGAVDGAHGFDHGAHDFVNGAPAKNRGIKLDRRLGRLTAGDGRKRSVKRSGGTRDGAQTPRGGRTAAQALMHVMAEPALQFPSRARCGKAAKIRARWSKAGRRRDRRRRSRRRCVGRCSVRQCWIGVLIR